MSSADTTSGSGNEREAIQVVHAAIDAGVTFMDNAWEYHEGRSEDVMGKAIADRRAPSPPSAGGLSATVFLFLDCTNTRLIAEPNG